MHGIIFQQLQSFVTKNYGVRQWIDLLNSAGLKDKIYLPTKVYPDDDAVAIATKASEATKIPPKEILESFGEFIAPSLLKIYAASIDPKWNTIDLLEHVENTIHKAVRFADKTATPPELVCERPSKKAVTINYSSKRKMVDVGVGIIKAIAKIKNEVVEIRRADIGETTKLEIQLVN